MRKRTAELRVRIDKGIYDCLKQIAEEEGRSISELVRQAVAQLLLNRHAYIRQEASLAGQRLALMRGNIEPGGLDL